jgi:predicted polyphosphate/ATP-dependent NAD kinase
MEKILSLPERHLLVDTGDERLDQEIRGNIRVVTGLHQKTVLKIV